MIQNLNSTDFILQNLDPSSPRVKAVRSNKGYVLLIKADWCGHCRRYLPIFRDQSIKRRDYTFLILDHDKNETLLRQWANLESPAFEANSFPTIIIYDASGMPLRKFEEDRTKLDTLLV